MTLQGRGGPPAEGPSQDRAGDGERKEGGGAAAAAALEGAGSGQAQAGFGVAAEQTYQKRFLLTGFIFLPAAFSYPLPFLISFVFSPASLSWVRRSSLRGRRRAAGRGAGPASLMKAT